MEPSPLTQQARPEVFIPKVVELYEKLFRVGYNVPVSWPYSNMYDRTRRLRNQKGSGGNCFY